MAENDFWDFIVGTFVGIVAFLVYTIFKHLQAARKNVPIMEKIDKIPLKVPMALRSPRPQKQPELVFKPNNEVKSRAEHKLTESPKPSRPSALQSSSVIGASPDSARTRLVHASGLGTQMSASVIDL